MAPSPTLITSYQRDYWHQANSILTCLSLRCCSKNDLAWLCRLSIKCDLLMLFCYNYFNFCLMFFYVLLPIFFFFASKITIKIIFSETNKVNFFKQAGMAYNYYYKTVSLVMLHCFVQHVDFVQLWYYCLCSSFVTYPWL